MRSNYALILLTFLTVIGWSLHVVAASVTSLEVNNEGDKFNVRLEMTLNAPVKYVREVVTDYRHIYRLNPSIIESRVTESSNTSNTRVYTKISDCVLFFCREVSRVEDVSENNTGNLVARIVPEYSDFDSGITTWEFREVNGQTRVVYNAQFQPNFFIPPVVGDYLVTSKLKESLVASFMRIECNARIRRLIAETKNDVVNIVRQRSSLCQARPS